MFVFRLFNVTSIFPFELVILCMVSSSTVSVVYSVDLWCVWIIKQLMNTYIVSKTRRFDDAHLN